jgi:ABC-type Fe3+/spermidine/putrescine transport system ATPase subunit
MDTPVDIYKNPKTLFVADFIGESNILKGIVTDINEKTATIDVGNNLQISVLNEGYNINDNKVLIIRPKDIRISKNETKNSIPVKVIDNIYNGEITKFIVSVNDKIELKVNSIDDVWHEEGEIVYISFDINDLVVLGDNNEKRK